MRFYTIIIFCLFAQVATADDYTRQFPSQQRQPLLLGEDTIQLLTVTAKTPLSMGTAWILVSPGHGQFNLKSALLLANNLSKKGWASKIIPPEWLSSPELDSEINQNSTDDELAPWQSVMTAQLDYENARSQLLDTLIALDTQSQSSRGFKLVIAEGLIAALVLASGKEAQLNQPDGLIMISPFWPDHDINLQIPVLSADYPKPLLDIASPASRTWSGQQATQREIEADVQIKLQYRQRTLATNMAASRTTQPIEYISKEIIGWTRSLGW